MSFMQAEITEKQYGWSVETNEGTSFVPGDVYPVPDYLARDARIDLNDGRVFDALSAYLRDYVEGSRIESISVCRGYFARMQAPGYLDCTSWCCYSTLKEARRELRDMYGEED